MTAPAAQENVGNFKCDLLDDIVEAKKRSDLGVGRLASSAASSLYQDNQPKQLHCVLGLYHQLRILGLVEHLPTTHVNS
jgi:hypothetical protein